MHDFNRTRCALRIVARALAAIALVLTTPACDPSSSGSGDGLHGPHGGILDFDASAIPDPPGPGTGPDDAAVGVDTGGGVTQCTGTATPCSVLSDTQCTRALGCSMKGTCGGSATICGFIFNQYECLTQQGCFWNSQSKCDGFSWTCDTFTGSTSCAGQQGCSWSQACGGTPTPCSLISVANCPTQPGCHVETH
jgi:hypothetical protein